MAKRFFYIVWFYCPSRTDTLDQSYYFVDPLVYTKSTTDIGITKINNIHSGITVTNKVNETSLHLGIYEEFKESSIDPYVSMRNAYFELRRKKIKEWIFRKDEERKRKEMNQLKKNKHIIVMVLALLLALPYSAWASTPTEQVREKADKVLKILNDPHWKTGITQEW